MQGASQWDSSRLIYEVLLFTLLIFTNVVWLVGVHEAGERIFGR